MSQTLVLPQTVQSEVDLNSVLVRAKPFSDAEELLPVCYRCSTTNPLLNTQVRRFCARAHELTLAQTAGQSDECATRAAAHHCSAPTSGGQRGSCGADLT